VVLTLHTADLIFKPGRLVIKKTLCLHAQQFNQVFCHFSNFLAIVSIPREDQNRTISLSSVKFL